MLLCFDKKPKPVNPDDEVPPCEFMTVIWQFGESLCAYPHLTFWVMICSGNCSVYCHNVLKTLLCYFIAGNGYDKDYGEWMVTQIGSVLIDYGFGRLNWKAWSQPSPKNDSVIYHLHPLCIYNHSFELVMLCIDIYI